MKAYRNPEITLPEPFEPVLVFAEGDDVAMVAYYDDEQWFEAHTGEQLNNVHLWMPIPIRPFE